MWLNSRLRFSRAKYIWNCRPHVSTIEVNFSTWTKVSNTEVSTQVCSNRIKTYAKYTLEVPIENLQAVSRQGYLDG